MTGTAEIRVLHHAEDQVGESPLWDAASGCLWWVDISGQMVRRLDVATGIAVGFALPVAPGALAQHEDGSLVLAGGVGWHRLDPDTGKLSPIASAPGAAAGWRMNDGAVDQAGRFWTGTVDAPRGTGAGGRLYRMEGGSVHEVLRGLKTQNGAAFSPDARTFYLADSNPAACVIWAFDFDLATGMLGERRIFHSPERGRPDGAAVDSDGCYWFAAIDAGEIVRLDPDGRPIEAITLPVSRPTNLAFGGPDLSTLYVTTMRAGLEEAQLADQPLAGAVFAVAAGVRGWPQPRVTATGRPLTAAAASVGGVQHLGGN